MTITIYIDVMYVEIPATREKCRNLQEIVQEFAGISGICRNIRNLQEFAGIAGPWHPWLHGGQLSDAGSSTNQLNTTTATA